MRKMDHYGLKLCQFQAQLFQNSIEETECSSGIFVRRFMHSDLAKRMDTDGFLFDAIDLEDALSEIQIEFGKSDYGKIKYGSEELYWAGYIYRYWSYINEKSSKQIYKIIKPDELCKLYFPYHSLDPEQVIERIKESKGIKEENDIQRGVEVMRKVRAKHANKPR